MKNTKDYIEVLPTSNIIEERELCISHTPFEIEKMFYSCISRGDVEELEHMMMRLFENKIVVGKLSSNNLRQIQYTAVCSITLATRYAIIGGLDETIAYNFSDECIMKIDSIKETDQILDFLIKKSKEITLMVAKTKNRLKYPKPVNKCLKYISSNLFEKLNLSNIAKECNVSKDYLSLLFKKSLGITIPQYIKKERLNIAKELIQKNIEISKIAYTIGFCSESYFIKCFKDEFGITPLEYYRNCI